MDDRRKTKEALLAELEESRLRREEAEKTLDAVLEQAGEAVVLCHESGRVIRASRMTHGLCSCNPSGARFDDLFPLVREKDGKPFYATGALRGESYRGVEVALKGKDGRLSDLLVSATPLTGGNRKITNCVITMTDLTARRQAQEALSAIENRLQIHTEELQAANEELAVQAEELQVQNEELRIQRKELIELSDNLMVEQARLQAVLEHMPAGVIIVEVPSGKILLVNRQMERILRHPVPQTESLETYSPYQGFFANGRPYRPQDYPLVRAASKGLVVLDEEIDILRGDGSRGVIHASATPIRDSQGAIVAAVGIYHDVSERKQAEKEIARLASFPQLNPNPVLETDLYGRVTFDNAATLKVLERLGSQGGVEDFLPNDMAAILQEAKETGKILFQREVEIEDAVFAESISFPADLKVARIYAMDITKRKRAEEALRRAKEEWESTFDAVPDLILILDNEHRIVRANQAMAQALGMEPEELQGRKCHECMHNLPHAPDFCPHSRLLADGREHVAEVQELGRDFLVSASPLQDHQGRLIGSVHVARDITDRKQAEEALRRAHEELEQRVEERTAELKLVVEELQWEMEIRQQAEDDLRKQADLLDLAHDAILVRDLDSRIIFWNRGAEATYGWKKEEALGRVTHDLLQTQVPTSLEELNRSLMDKGQWQGELVHHRADGSAVVVASRQALQRDNQGEPIAILEINRDITERKQAEEALGRERQRFYDVLEMLPAYIVLLTPDYHVPFANRFFVERFGESQGMRCFEYLFGRSEPCEICETYKVLQTHAPHRWEWTGPDGRNYDIYDYPFTDADGSPLIMEMGIDITERKRAEEEIQKLNAELEQRVRERTAQLEAANDELEAFSYSVSHDLRAPLRAISGFSRMLADEHTAKLDAEGLRLLEVINTSTQTMAQLIDDLLSFSRLGRQEILLWDLDLAGMVHSIFADLKASSPERKVQLHLQPLPPAYGDRTLINQVLVNLLANALKFTRPKETAQIEVGGWIEGNETIYYVKDNGVGFDMRFVDKLFGVFQTLHPRTEFEGTGVGLAIVERIIHRHGGRTWAEGKVDEGATFYFSCPDFRK